jgi:prepilin-type N-terminal cleavage/methylation domain-containing protein
MHHGVLNRTERESPQMVNLPSKKPSAAGFTLGEILVTMSVMGIVACFALPTLFTSQSTLKYKAISKEAALMVDSAYTAYGLTAQITAATTAADFILTTNYLREDTTTNANTVPAGETALAACSTLTPCLQLHSGALLQYSSTNSFAGTASNRYITFNIDPDGAGSKAGKVSFLLYYNGKIVSGSNANGNTGPGALAIVADPAWLAGWNT